MESDEDLVQRTLIGDLDAFGGLVERHRDVVVRIAARIVGPSDAEDVSQDAFLHAFHRLGDFRHEAPFRSWLLQIVQNASLAWLRRSRRSTSVDPVDVEEETDPHDPRTPIATLERRERGTRLELKLSQLRPPHRAVLVLRDLEGFTYEEIAEMTETPIGSVKGRLHRARQELIALLRNNTYDWELPND